MNTLWKTNSVHLALVLLASSLLLVVVPSITAGAQDATAKNSSSPNRTSSKPTTGDPSLAAQIRELQAKLAKLEAALEQGMKKEAGMSMGMGKGKGMSGMGMMSGKKGMMSGQKTDEMGSMSGKGTSGMGMMGQMKGMGMMGQMKGMGQMQMPSALPGFAGASHIYHIGATSFFLDHPQHITLTKEQQTKLNEIKEKALLGQATADRWISQAEQELWVLTGSDAPEAAKIEATIREIEKLRGDNRIAFIQAVGKAASLLTDEQRQTLVGNLPPDHNAKGAGNQN